MTTGLAAGAGPPDDRVRELDPLLREHARLRAEFAAALTRRSTFEGDGAAELALEEQTAERLSRYLCHLSWLADESVRRGVHLARLEALFASVSAGTGGLDPEHAFTLGAPGGPHGPAMEPWRRAAAAGSAPAQYVLAEALLAAPRSAVDVQEGRHQLDRAAQQNHRAAMLSQAVLLLSGSTGPDEMAQGLELLRRVADLGEAEACWRLAMRHASGDGVPQDTPKALQLMERAAEAGHPEAQLELGRVHAVGIPGVGVDHAKAVHWLSKAAERHRDAAREWIAAYGSLTPAAYRSATWLESWTPRELPPAPPSGRTGMLVSLGLLALLVIGALQGNSLLLFLLLLFLAVLMHEAGHWLVARWVGIPILVFTVGAGPLVRSFPILSGRLPMRIDLKILPLLGHVRPYVVPKSVFRHWEEQRRRETAKEPPPPLPEFDTNEEPEPAFLHVSRPRRLAFLFGGLAVNFFAAVAFLFAYESCSDEAALYTAPVAGRVPPGSIAAQAGIVEGDRFVAVDGAPVRGFFDVQRRLAPVDRSGVAAPPADPAGRRVPIDIRRRETEIRLEWPTPPAPPSDKAAEAYGLLPPESWRIARVHESIADELKPGGEIVAFSVGGRRTWVWEPGAHARLRDALADAAGEPIQIHTPGDRSDRGVAIRPRSPEVSGERRAGASIEFARLREPGPRDGLRPVMAQVLSHGWDALVELPRDMVASLRAPPTPEQKGWLMEAVRRDPWAGARTFALIHAVLLFLNLVPIPPLDGFQILCTLLESAVRRPLPRRGLGIALRIGWAVLLLWIALNVFLILRDLAGSVL